MKLLQNFILCWVCVCPALVFSQKVSMDGPSSVYAGSEVHYFGFNVISGNIISAGFFSVSNTGGSASIVTEYTTIGTEKLYDGNYHSSFQIKATFSGSGVATVSVTGGDGASMNVTVKAEWQRPPVVSIVTNENCGSTAVYRLQSPPPGITWWWQTNSTDRGSGLGSGDNILLYTNVDTPLYIRSSNTDGTQWSDAVSLGTIHVYKTPPPPPTVAGNVTDFFGNQETLSVNNVDGAMYYNWYNAAGELMHQGNTYQNTFLKTETFNVATSNGCESATLPVTVTILPIPKIIVQGGGSTDLSNGPVTLTTQSGYKNYSWRYSADNSFVNTISTYVGFGLTCTVSNPGFYSVEVSTADNRSSSSPHFQVGTNENTNYITTNVMQVKGITDALSVGTLPITQRSESVQYFDGLGRLSQTVITQGSPAKNDIVQSFTYDKFGRETRKYLPYIQNETNGWSKIDPIGSVIGYTSSPQHNFYQSAFAISQDNAPYEETISEASPLNRVLKRGAAGTVWQPDAVSNYTSTDHTIKFDYQTNITGEVLFWSYVAPSPDNPLGLVTAKNGNNLVYYDANQLSKTKTKDEQQHEVIEYKDKEGRIILKKVQANNTEWAQTYYVYNDFGNLVVVLPPEAVKAFGNDYLAN